MGMWTKIKQTGKTGYKTISGDKKKAATASTSRKYKIVKKPKLVGYKQVPKKVKGKWVVEKVPQIKMVSTKVYAKVKPKKKKTIKQFLRKEGVKARKRPSIKPAVKRVKRKPLRDIKTSLGYNRKLNLGGLY